MPRPAPAPEDRAVQTSISVPMHMLDDLAILQIILPGVDSRSALSRLAFDDLLAKHSKAIKKYRAANAI